MHAAFQPGDLVRHYAGLFHWPVADRTILVEGEHDQRYFVLADKLYAEKTQLKLLCSQMAIFPTGIGDEGGSFGLQRHFHPLRAVMDRDMTQNGQKIFHAIALFDDDIEGRRGFGALTAQHLNYRKWRDVFLLQRFIPRSTRDPVQVDKLIGTANNKWRGMECEIEDLVAIDMIKEFVSENPNCIQRQLEERNGAVHCRFHRHAKANFIRFVEKNAILEDLSLIVDTLKSLRYYLGLPPDGETISNTLMRE